MSKHIIGSIFRVNVAEQQKDFSDLWSVFYLELI